MDWALMSYVKYVKWYFPTFISFTVWCELSVGCSWWLSTSIIWCEAEGPVQVPNIADTTQGPEDWLGGCRNICCAGSSDIFQEPSAVRLGIAQDGPAVEGQQDRPSIFHGPRKAWTFQLWDPGDPWWPFCEAGLGCWGAGNECQIISINVNVAHSWQGKFWFHLLPQLIADSSHAIGMMASWVPDGSRSQHGKKADSGSLMNFNVSVANVRILLNLMQWDGHWLCAFVSDSWILTSCRIMIDAFFWL